MVVVGGVDVADASPESVGMVWEGGEPQHSPIPTYTPCVGRGNDLQEAGYTSRICQRKEVSTPGESRVLPSPDFQLPLGNRWGIFGCAKALPGEYRGPKTMY